MGRVLKFLFIYFFLTACGEDEQSSPPPEEVTPPPVITNPGSNHISGEMYLDGKAYLGASIVAHQLNDNFFYFGDIDSNGMFSIPVSLFSSSLHYQFYVMSPESNMVTILDFDSGTDGVQGITEFTGPFGMRIGAIHLKTDEFGKTIIDTVKSPSFTLSSSFAIAGSQQESSYLGLSAGSKNISLRSTLFVYDRTKLYFDFINRTGNPTGYSNSLADLSGSSFKFQNISEQKIAVTYKPKLLKLRLSNSHHSSFSSSSEWIGRGYELDSSKEQSIFSGALPKLGDGYLLLEDNNIRFAFLRATVIYPPTVLSYQFGTSAAVNLDYNAVAIPGITSNLQWSTGDILLSITPPIYRGDTYGNVTIRITPLFYNGDTLLLVTDEQINDPYKVDGTVTLSDTNTYVYSRASMSLALGYSVTDFSAALTFVVPQALLLLQEVTYTSIEFRIDYFTDHVYSGSSFLVQKAVTN